MEFRKLHALRRKGEELRVGNSSGYQDGRLWRHYLEKGGRMGGWRLN